MYLVYNMTVFFSHVWEFCRRLGTLEEYILKDCRENMF